MLKSNGRSLPAPLEAPSPVLDPDAARAPVSHQLPPHQSKAGRVGDHLAAISADLREVVELRIDLVKAEVTEKVEAAKATGERFGEVAKFGVPAAVLALYLLGFVLATLAIGLGWWLGNLFWGALIVTGLLLLTVGTLGLIAKSKLDRAKAVAARLKPTPKATETAAATPGPPTRPQLQDLEREHARQSTT